MCLTSRELATVLAGLRALQGTRSRQELEEIATDGGRLSRLTDAEIDALADRLNDDPDAERSTLNEHG